MGTAQGMIKEALKHEGYLETPVNHTKFGKAFDWDGVSWCHIFLSVCAKWSGNGDVIPWTAGCATGWDWFRDRGQFFRRGVKTPKAGDIVYYGPTGGDHVGLVVSVSDGYIHTIEGNTSTSSGYNPNGGGVHRKKWPLNYSRIYGYGRPDYQEEDDMPLSDQDIDKLIHALLNAPLAAAPGHSKPMAFMNLIRETYGRTSSIFTIVSALAQAEGSDVDEAAIVKGILEGLSPERIAEAIPETIAKDVADELASRLAA